MSQAITSFRDLKAWQHAFKLGLEIYRLTLQFPSEERFGLTSQLRRGAVAVPSNIAEGYGRQSQMDYVRFLRIARGALNEIETQLMFALELNYIQQDQFDTARESMQECAKTLGGLIRSVERASA